MQGIHDAESADGSAPPDWPEPGTPLPSDEPTIELPAVTDARNNGTTTPSLARAALSMVLAQNAADAAALAETEPDHPASDEDYSVVPGFGYAQDDAESFDAPSFEPEPFDPEWSDTGWSDSSTPDSASPDFASPDAEWAETEPPTTEWPSSVSPAAPDQAPAPPGRRWLVGAGIAAAALLLTGTTVVLLSSDGDPPAGDNGNWSPPAAAAAGNTATAALDGRTIAGFDLIDGAKNVTLRAADLGDSLYRITTPEGSNVTPRADEQDGRIRLRLDGDVESLDVTLNAAVLWDLRVAGGAELSTIDLSAGRVGGVDLTGGASRINLTLPKPDGTLSVRMSGGVSLFDVRTTGQVPVRVRVGSGAGQVTLDGLLHSGVAAGQTFTPDRWGETVDRVDVDASAGMSAMTVAPY